MENKGNSSTKKFKIDNTRQLVGEYISFFVSFHLILIFCSENKSNKFYIKYCQCVGASAGGDGDENATVLHKNMQIP